uniref:Uncharacterized protein n=1 Tax=Anguilla anguilla TaxID=7936 RepID=A0A0E9VTH5_ANGAN
MSTAPLQPKHNKQIDHTICKRSYHLPTGKTEFGNKYAELRRGH